MRSPTAKHYWRPISLLCALLALTACGSERVVYRDRVVEVPQPVPAKLDPALTADCPPRGELPATGRLPVGSVLDRTAAVEDALALCREQLKEIRSTQEDPQ